MKTRCRSRRRRRIRIGGGGLGGRRKEENGEGKEPEGWRGASSGIAHKTTFVTCRGVSKGSA